MISLCLTSGSKGRFLANVANTILFNKKTKIGRAEHLLTPHSLRLTTSIFCLTALPPSSPAPFKVDVICVSTLSGNKLYHNLVNWKR